MSFLEPPRCLGPYCGGLAEESCSELGLDCKNRRLELGHCLVGPASAWGVGTAPQRLAGLPPSSMIWKCRKWDYPGTDVHKGGEMEGVTVAPAFDYL